jgi:hypothetical protein
MNSDTVKSKILDCTITFTEIDEFFGDISIDRSDVIIELLNESLINKNGIAVDNLIYAAYKNGVNESFLEVLCKLIEVREEWLYKHEDIATLLEKIKSPASVPYLYRLADNYETSDMHSIPLKAMWALRAIGNLEAEESLSKLCQSSDERKAKIAKQQLEYLQKSKEST